MIAKWKSEIKKGIWQCIYINCGERFVDPSKFLNHVMKYYQTDKLRAKIFAANQMPCCFCETVTAISGFARHLNQNHHDVSWVVMSYFFYWSRNVATRKKGHVWWGNYNTLFYKKHYKKHQAEINKKSSRSKANS